MTLTQLKILLLTSPPWQWNQLLKSLEHLVMVYHMVKIKHLHPLLEPLHFSNTEYWTTSDLSANLLILANAHYSSLLHLWLSELSAHLHMDG